MSVQFSTSTLRFTAADTILHYKVKCIPATDTLKLSVEGAYEIALANIANPVFGKELILLPDTSTQPNKIEREIIVRKNANAAKGSIIHAFAKDAQTFILNLEVEETLTKSEKPSEIAKTLTPPIPPTTPKKEIATPPSVIPKFTFNKTELIFGKITPGANKVLSFSIQSQAIPKYTVEVSLPFKLSLDGKTFSNTLSIEPNSKSEEKQIFVQMQSIKEGKFKQSIIIRTANSPLRQVLVNGHCTTKVALPLPKAKHILYTLLAFAGIWGVFSLVGNQNQTESRLSVAKNPKVFPQNPINPIAVSLDDPTCKPSLYQKLKEKSTVVRYGCVNKDCDTAFVRDVLTYASGSKAFRFVKIDNQSSTQGCGKWVEQVFKENKVDIMFTDENCELANIDQSHSICVNPESNVKCSFLVPCGNSEGLLKVLNKEIRRRKSKMNILN